MFGKVIVGVGDVPHGCDAIALARVLAPQGELHVVHAYPRDPRTGSLPKAGARARVPGPSG